MVVKFNDSNTFKIALAVSKDVKQLMLFSADTRRIKKPSFVTSFSHRIDDIVDFSFTDDI